MAYEFTNNWFESTAKPIWDQLIPLLKPHRILEIGSYEGASACYMVDTLGSEQDLHLYCVDSWAGGVEHADVQMGEVEQRFLDNIARAKKNATKKIYMHVRKGLSAHVLPNLMYEGHVGTIDFIYIDGSHQAPDVLTDAVMAFNMLKVGGVMVFDDYLWEEVRGEGRDVLMCPKMAIDAFTNLFIRKIQFFGTPLNQVWIRKITD